MDAATGRVGSCRASSESVSSPLPAIEGLLGDLALTELVVRAETEPQLSSLQPASSVSPTTIELNRAKKRTSRSRKQSKARRGRSAIFVLPDQAGSPAAALLSSAEVAVSRGDIIVQTLSVKVSAAVFHTHHPRLGQDFILKVSTDSSSLAKEATTLSFLSKHLPEQYVAMIPQYCDQWQTRGWAVLRLGFVSGVTLSTWLDARSDSAAFEQNCLTIFAQLVSFVQFLHSRFHIVHRDLKPANILIQSSGSPVILDWELAVLLPPGQFLTEAVGSWAYAAPEIHAARPYDHGVDIWSLGVTMFEMVCGRLPFVGPDAQTLATTIANLQNPPELPPDVVSSVGTALITQMQQPDPKQRASLTSLLELLSQSTKEEVASSGQLLGCPAFPPPQPPFPSQKLRQRASPSPRIAGQRSSSR